MEYYLPLKRREVLFLFYFLKFIYLFIYFWLCWVFVSVQGLSLVVESGGHSSSWCAGLSLSRPLLLRSTGSRHAGSVIVAHGPSCSVACGIFPDQGSNPCPLHWQADSQLLCHQGSPRREVLIYATTWMKLEDIMQRKIRQTQKDKYCRIPTIVSRIVKFIETEGRMVVDRSTGEETMGSYCLMNMEFPFGMMKKF